MNFDADAFQEELDNKWSDERRARFVNKMKHKLDAKERRFSR